MLSPRVPPLASCRVRRDCSSIIQTAAVWGASLAALTGRCAVLALASSSPARPVPARPKARLSTRPLIRYSSSARPLRRPFIGKLMMSVVASGKALLTVLPVQRTAQSRPSGPKARSPTRVLEKCFQPSVLGSKLSTPLPDET